MKAPMSRDDFISLIDNIKKFDDSTRALDKALNEYDETSDFGGFTNFRAMDIIANLLNLLFQEEEDDYGSTTIEYFMYDLDFGKEYKPGVITEADGTLIDLSNAGSLYDYLVKSHDFE